MQKMIYIRKEDIELFDKAQELSDDSLSGILAEALKDYVAKLEGGHQGFEVLTFKIGKDLTPSGSGTYRKIRFTGKKIVESKTTLGDRIKYDGGTDWELYLTPNQGWVAIRENWETEHNPIEGVPYYITRDFWIASTLEELQSLKDGDFPLIQPELINIAKESSQKGFIEYLDI